MPTKYIRKGTCTRGNWSAESLQEAMNAVTNGMAVKRAAENFGIPRKTLERRIKQNNPTKTQSLGPGSCFGEKNERKLALHIKKMQKHGFPSTVDDIRQLAYHFAEQLEIKHKFNKTTQKAGYDWFHLFLSRNRDLTIRKAESVSIARGLGMNRVEVSKYFELLGCVLEENDLFNKPGSIFNVDETGLQLNNRSGHVIAEKGSKDVHCVSSAEKGETISVIACCNAEGIFLPPVSIFKGKNKKAEFEDGMPPGATVYMSEKSAYVNTSLFLRWIQECFIPRKPNGKVLLILDGHASHCTSVELLEVAEANDIILICLPSHTTHYLQPLDRAVFKAVKSYFYAACNNWIRTNPGRQIKRLQFGHLLSESWGKAAIPANAISGFKATGIFPFNPSAIPQHAFDMSDQTIQNSNENLRTNLQSESLIPTNTNEGLVIPVLDPQPGTSNVSQRHCHTSPELQISQKPTSLNFGSPITPSKVLDSIRPVPTITPSLKRKTKQLGSILTSPENIAQVKERACKRKSSEMKKQMKQQVKKLVQKKKKSKIKADLSSSESDSEPELVSDDDVTLDVSEDDCVGCGENYKITKKKMTGWNVLIVSAGFMKVAQAFKICAKTVVRKRIKTNLSIGHLYLKALAVSP